MTPTSRRAAVAATWCVGTVLLRASLSSRPGSREFYVRTASVAGVWAAGSRLAPRAPRTEVRLSLGFLAMNPGEEVQSSKFKVQSQAEVSSFKFQVPSSGFRVLVFQFKL